MKLELVLLAWLSGGPADKAAVTKKPTSAASQPASQPASKPVPPPPKPPRTEDDELLEDLDFLEFLQMEDEAPWFVE